jgi:hypothetical protein
MAFIRWKKNKFGLRQAYLIHSYRGEDGKPKHKTLAYLGREGSIDADQIALLQKQHKDLSIDWAAIKAVEHPPAVTDISVLTDWELAQQVKQLRQERGITMKGMVERLQQAGITTVSSGFKPDPMTYSTYRWLENGWQSSSHPGFQQAATQLAPYFRKIL